MAEDKTLNEINKRFGITGRKARDIAKKVNSVVASPKPATKKAAAKPAPKKPTAKPVAPAKKTPMPKTTGAKPSVKKPMPKPLTGPAAIAEIQRRVSPAGVKKAEMDAKKATAKKYPGLTKKSK